MTFDDEDKQNRYILYQYCILQFLANNLSSDDAKSEAQKLMLKYKDNLFGKNGLAYILGSQSIEFFCCFFLQDTFIPKPNNTARILAPVHYQIWDTLESMFLTDEFDKLELIMPRGAAKTTVCDFALSVWLHCYKKSTYTLVAGKTEQDATEFVSQARQAFEENSYIIKAFGNLIDTKRFIVNKLELELSNHTKIQAISSTSSMRGKKYNGSRPSCIIADDYQSKADCITIEARDKKYNTWVEDSGYAGDKAVYRSGKKIKQATKYIVLGTILHRDCFMSRLVLNKDYKHLLKRVVPFDVDKFFHSGLWEQFRTIYFNDKLQDSVSEAKEFYYQHEKEMQYETLWSDKYDCLDLSIDYLNNPTAFKQEMMNDASKIGEKWFTSNKVESKDEIESHSFTKTMLCVDPASTSNRNSDSFSFIVGSLADNGFKYVRKGELIKYDARTEVDKYINHVIELLKAYPDIISIYIEKQTFNGVDANMIEKKIQSDFELSNRTISIVNEAQHKNKDDKIAAVVPDVNNGRIIFNADDIDFINEVTDFAGQNYSVHDDAPDCLAEFANRIDDIEIFYPVVFLDKRKFY